MQPLAYFAARMLFGWLQYLEKSDRAFVSNGLLIIATGAAHAWAVVYAMFIAIHMRAMRYDGYHEGYREHLPFWVSWTETLAVASMGIWWAAGFTTAAIRIIDDDARGLPSSARDVDVALHLQLMRSPRLRWTLEVAHTLSCVGLFVSIMLLCVAMALMRGAVTACELCLCLVAGGFALPHAVVARRRLRRGAAPGPAERTAGPAAAPAEAAAREAAALGPQLCVVLALADSPGHAYLWQKLAYLSSAAAFLAAVAACLQCPPRASGAALPPDLGELLCCALLDAVASVALVMCFPHLNTWHLWALALMLVVLFAALTSRGCRAILVDLLDPLLALRSESGRALPGVRRQGACAAARAAAAACALAALWDIALHPVQQGLLEPPPGAEDSEGAGPPELWDPSAMLLLRWRQGGERGGETPGRPRSQPDEQGLLRAASGALGLEPAALALRASFPEHRLLLFGPAAGGAAAQGGGPALHTRWAAATIEGRPAVAGLLEVPFPAALNVTLCLHAHASVELARQHAEEAGASDGVGMSAEAGLALPGDFLEAVGASPEAHRAYLAACDWWTERLDLYYGSDKEARRHLAEAGLEGSRDAEGSANGEGFDLA
uniref:Uncharacterized protein n=1 Tax=Alexandrium monilatum TaxID=311494 RepID=A0A7S4SM97_9DINO|mmetsp:Transcript_86766/g.268628  ORF Transcript_86766/g.268628 Transcript_86766/m.268628 type:complete len:608 (-) Transcript_86766:132-1955(-)